MHIRFATTEDTPALLQIYSQYIQLPITFEAQLPSAQTFEARMRSMYREYPYLICEEDGVIQGYAYAHRQFSYDAYQWGAELTVYVDQQHAAKGIGRAIYRCLINILMHQNVYTVYALVTAENQPSVHFHTAFGFREIGVHRSAGFTADGWRDVIWFEKPILPYDVPPKPFCPLSALPAELCNRILSAAL